MKSVALIAYFIKISDPLLYFWMFNEMSYKSGKWHALFDILKLEQNITRVSTSTKEWPTADLTLRLGPSTRDVPRIGNINHLFYMKDFKFWYENQFAAEVDKC